jgi:hypothetical protein
MGGAPNHESHGDQGYGNGVVSDGMEPGWKKSHERHVFVLYWAAGLAGIRSWQDERMSLVIAGV